MGTRRKSREAVLQFLYQGELSGQPLTEENFVLFCSRFDVSRKAVPYAGELVALLLAHWDEITGLISRHAANWRLARMPLIDRNVLRIAVCELCFRDDVPARVVINEAIEVAKRFGTEESGPFINGILDAIQKTEDREQKTEDRGQGTEDGRQ